MIYEEVRSMSRDEAERAFRGENPSEIARALVSVAFHDPDWRWVEGKCLDLLNSPSEIVRGIAVTCLGHLGRIHGKLDLAIVLPALEVMRREPALTGKVEDALGDISRFVNRG